MFVISGYLPSASKACRRAKTKNDGDHNREWTPSGCCVWNSPATAPHAHLADTERQGLLPIGIVATFAARIVTGFMFLMGATPTL